MSVVAIDFADDDPIGRRGVNGWVCVACDGALRDMGRVDVPANVLVREGERCACDERCTHARGPMCVCRCGGVNHGTGAVVPYTVTVGAVPRVHVPKTAEAMAVAREWRALLTVARAHWNTLQGEGRYTAAARMRRAIHKARGMNSHRGRVRVLAAAFPPRLDAPTTVEAALRSVAEAMAIQHPAALPLAKGE